MMSNGKRGPWKNGIEPALDTGACRTEWFFVVCHVELAVGDVFDGSKTNSDIPSSPLSKDFGSSRRPKRQRSIINDF